jgi:hypothetical protein
MQDTRGELLETLRRERDNSFATITTLGTIRWAMIGGLLAVVLAVFSVVAGLDAQTSPLVLLFGDYVAVVHGACGIGVFLLLAMLLLNVYFELTITEQSIRAQRAGEAIGVLQECEHLAADLGLRLDSRWGLDRTLAGLLLLFGGTAVIGFPALGIFWQAGTGLTRGQYVLSFAGALVVCASAVAYSAFRRSHLEKSSAKVTKDLLSRIPEVVEASLTLDSEETSPDAE